MQEVDVEEGAGTKFIVDAQFVLYRIYITLIVQPYSSVNRPMHYCTKLLLVSH